MSLYLVTGGAGFIGSNIVEHLLNRGEKVRVLDNFATGHRENIASFINLIELLEGDIRNRELVKKALHGVDYVLHQAALGSIARSIADPLETNSCNVDGTVNLLFASAEAGVKRFVYASSSSVYGNTPELPKNETISPLPCSPYGVSKYVGELYCRIFYDIYRLETVILRYFNVFGRRQDPASHYAAVIPTFISSLLEGRAPRIFGTGEQSRDFTFVDNVVQANIKACSPRIQTFGEAFNIACGERTSVIDLYKKISALLSKETLPIFCEARAGEVKHTFADISKARNLLGYEPETDLNSGLLKTVEWYRQNLERASLSSENHQ
jgi:nucleoside-diphosphate-sugar epimerase